MQVLALDLGSSTGWALGPSVVSGTWTHKPGRYDGGGMRYLRFRAWLSEMQGLAENRLGAVFFEEVRGHKGVDAAHVYGGFLAHLSAWCEENGVPYEGVPVQTIKKHATGKGNSGKPAMIAAASAWVGRRIPADADDEADALCLLRWVLETRPEFSQTRRRVRVG